MAVLPHNPSRYFSPLHNFIPYEYSVVCKTTRIRAIFPVAKTHKSNLDYVNWCCKDLLLCRKFVSLRNSHVSFCSNNEEITTTRLATEFENDVELLVKPTPSPMVQEKEVKKSDKDEALEPFIRFFKPRDAVEPPNDVEMISERVVSEEREDKKVNVEYYDPKPGDFVVGVVVSGNENKLDVNIGADLLATMLTKEVLPLYNKELDYLLCDKEKDVGEFMEKGKMGIVRGEDSLDGETVPGRPVVEPGTVLFAEVLGRTLSGRPLISTRRLFRRLAWHRVRQIKRFNEPIEVKITEWNTGGLITRIEGLRAFLPKVELISRINNFTELKENVGRRMFVNISRISEDTNDLILSEKEAWNMLHLKEGTLLEGTVKKIFSYGAQIRIGESNRSGLLHVSNISRTRVASVGDLLAIDEKVKVLVVRSMFPDKISLSIADLESEPGLFLRDREKVFSEADEMAKKYRKKIQVVSVHQELEPFPADTPCFEDEEKMYANWKWFKFERDDETK